MYSSLWKVEDGVHGHEEASRRLVSWHEMGAAMESCNGEERLRFSSSFYGL
jgi:hypothetical protein